MNTLTKILSLVVVIFLALAITSLITNKDNVSFFNKTETETSLTYQGAVPEGYDLKHFRETGETIKAVRVG